MLCYALKCFNEFKQRKKVFVLVIIITKMLIVIYIIIEATLFQFSLFTLFYFFLSEARTKYNYLACGEECHRPTVIPQNVYISTNSTNG